MVSADTVVFFTRESLFTNGMIEMACSSLCLASIEPFKLMLPMLYE